MSLQVICQRCGELKSSWTVHQALFDVREMRRWKMQLCELCAAQVEMRLRAVLEAPKRAHEPE